MTAIDRGLRRPVWSRGLVLAALAILIVVLAAYGTRFGVEPSIVDSPLIGQPAPMFDLPQLEADGFVSLGDFDDQVVVVNFWASWCVPCREEHPALLAAAERYRNDDVSFVGIVYQDQPGAATAFLDELGRGYDYVTDPDSTAAIDYGVFGIPETFFIGRDGIVAAKVIGRTDLAVLTDTIDAVLAGRRPGGSTGRGYEQQP